MWYILREILWHIFFVDGIRVFIILIIKLFQMDGNVFLTSVWLTSHFSILGLYFVLVIMKAVVSFFNKEYTPGFVAIIIGVTYECTYTLFIHLNIAVWRK